MRKISISKSVTPTTYFFQLFKHFLLLLEEKAVRESLQDREAILSFGFFKDFKLQHCVIFS